MCQRRHVQHTGFSSESCIIAPVEPQVSHFPPNGKCKLRLRLSQPTIARALTGAAVSLTQMLGKAQAPDPHNETRAHDGELCSPITARQAARVRPAPRTGADQAPPAPKSTNATNSPILAAPKHVLTKLQSDAFIETVNATASLVSRLAQ